MASEQISNQGNTHDAGDAAMGMQKDVDVGSFDAGPRLSSILRVQQTTLTFDMKHRCVLLTL